MDEPQFPQQLLFTDDFTEDAVFNMRNSHVWYYENPHALHVHAFQQRFGINVVVGILNTRLIGPYMLPPRLYIFSSGKLHWVTAVGVYMQCVYPVDRRPVNLEDCVNCEDDHPAN